MENNNMSISLDIKRLRSCRETLGITKQEAAKRIGVSQPAYVRYENGTRTPSVQVINEMARVLHTSKAYLTGQTDQNIAGQLFVDKTETPLLYSVVEQCRDCNEDQLNRLLVYLKNLH